MIRISCRLECSGPGAAAGQDRWLVRPAGAPDGALDVGHVPAFVRPWVGVCGTRIVTARDFATLAEYVQVPRTEATAARSEEPAAGLAEPTAPPSVIRAWAHENGYTVGERGRLHGEVIAAHHRTHAPRSRSADYRVGRAAVAVGRAVAAARNRITSATAARWAVAWAARSPPRTMPPVHWASVGRTASRMRWPAPS